MSDDRTNLIANTFMDSVQVVYNLLHRNPIAQDLPTSAVTEARGLVNAIRQGVISIFFYKNAYFYCYDNRYIVCCDLKRFISNFFTS